MELSFLYTLLTIAYIVFLSVWILLERRQPSSTLAWILAVVFLPYIGLFLYLLFGRQRLGRRTRLKALKTLNVDMTLPGFESTVASSLTRTAESDARLGRILKRREHLMELAMNNAEEPVTLGNISLILRNASQAYPSIFDAIAQARHYIHIEYYIFQPDDVGTRLRDALCERARAGVKVRFLFDGVGSWKLDRRWLRELEKDGADWASFLPLRLRRLRRFDGRLRVNFRNHRKLIVVDGRVGFTGGINVGREYEGASRLGHWRDTHLRLEGPCVRSLERIFHEDWYFATDELIEGEVYFPNNEQVGSDLVQIIPSGPDREWYPIHQQMFLAIVTARERCYITTPYFVPDEAIRTAMITAALRGVDLRLMVPLRSDQRLVRWAGRSYYEDLLRAGVRIYEYTRGFLHAKTLVVDSEFGTIGSANMDIRSFRLNFEVNAFVYSPEFALELEHQFQADLRDAREITLDAFMTRRLPSRFLESAARLMSPLL